MHIANLDKIGTRSIVEDITRNLINILGKVTFLFKNHVIMTANVGHKS